MQVSRWEREREEYEAYVRDCERASVPPRWRPDDGPPQPPPSGGTPLAIAPEVDQTTTPFHAQHDQDGERETRVAEERRLEGLAMRTAKLCCPSCGSEHLEGRLVRGRLAHRCACGRAWWAG